MVPLGMEGPRSLFKPLKEPFKRGYTHYIIGVYGVDYCHVCPGSRYLFSKHHDFGARKSHIHIPPSKLGKSSTGDIGTVPKVKIKKGFLNSGF